MRLGIGLGLTLRGAGSGSVSLTAPTLTWTSAETDATPEFTVDLMSPQVGDVITLEIADDSGFTTNVQTFTDTIDSSEAAAFQVNLGITAQSNGTYYARAKHSRGATDSAWSDPPVTVTINVSPAAATLTYADHAADTADLSTYTFAGRALGTPSATRRIVVGLGGRGFSASSATGVTVAGVTATKITEAGTWTTAGVALFIADVPTGATGDIVATFSVALARCCVAVWALYDAGSATPSDTKPVTANPSSATVVIPANGVALGYSYEITGTAAPTWSGMTQSFEDSVDGAGQRHSGAITSSAPGASVSASVTWTGPTNVSTVFAAWGP